MKIGEFHITFIADFFGCVFSDITDVRSKDFGGEGVGDFSQLRDHVKIVLQAGDAGDMQEPAHMGQGRIRPQYNVGVEVSQVFKELKLSFEKTGHDAPPAVCTAAWKDIDVFLSIILQQLNQNVFAFGQQLDCVAPGFEGGYRMTEKMVLSGMTDIDGDSHGLNVIIIQQKNVYFS